jgi:hypothetical protein
MASTEDVWAFDVSGFLHLPATLSAEQVAGLQLADASTAAAQLRAHPAVVAAIPELGCGETLYRLDHPPRLLPKQQTWFNSMAIEDTRRLGYHILPRKQPCTHQPNSCTRTPAANSNTGSCARRRQSKRVGVAGLAEPE